jgi:hypothetical protein
VENERKRAEEVLDEGEAKVVYTVEEEQKKYQEKKVDNERKTVAEYREREAEDGMEENCMEEEMKE